MPVDPMTIMSIVQTVGGAAQMIANSGKNKKLRKELKPLETPDEINDVLNLTMSMAQQGYDAGTLSYLTNSINNAATSSLQTADRLGGDPNDIGNILYQQADAFLKVGAQNQAEKFKNFGLFIDALKGKADADVAEQISKQNLIKDQLQAAQAGTAAGAQTLAGGLGGLNNAFSLDKISKLYDGQMKGLEDLFAKMVKNLPSVGMAGSAAAGGGNYYLGPDDTPPQF